MIKATPVILKYILCLLIAWNTLLHLALQLHVFWAISFPIILDTHKHKEYIRVNKNIANILVINKVRVSDMLTFPRLSKIVDKDKVHIIV